MKNNPDSNGRKKKINYVKEKGFAHAHTISSTETNRMDRN